MYKNQFPIFQNEKFNYLDTAASAQKPQAVIDEMVLFYQTKYANVHRGSCSLATTATLAYEEARKTIARFINASENQVVFTKSATEGLNLIANGYIGLLKEGDEILVSIAEHHANFVSWQQTALKTGAKFITFDILDNGEINMEDFEKKLSEKTKVVAITQLSNVLGIVNPIYEICQKSHQVGAKVVVDAAQSISHTSVDVQDLDCDFLVFSGHKLYGPTGIGILYGKEDALALLPPYQYGGDMVERVFVDKTVFKKSPYKFEAGTPAFVEAIGLKKAVEFVESVSFGVIEKHEKELTLYLMKELEKIKEVKILAPNVKKTGIVSFVVQDIHPSDIAFILAQQKICIREGHHCAMPLHLRLGQEVSLRASLGIYNEKEDIDAFIEALKKSISFFKR